MATTPNPLPVSTLSPASDAATLAAKMAGVSGGAPHPETPPVAPTAPTPEPASIQPPVESQPPAQQTEAVEDEFHLNIEEEPGVEAAVPVAEAIEEPPTTAADDPDAEIGKVLSGTARGKRIYAAHKFMRSLAQELGYEPSPDQIRDGLKALSAEQQLVADFRSPDPARQNNVAQYFFNPQWNFETDAFGRQVPGAAIRFAQALPAALAASNREAYAAMARSFGPLYNNHTQRQVHETRAAVVSSALGFLQTQIDQAYERGDTDAISSWTALHRAQKAHLEKSFQAAPAGSGQPSPTGQPSQTQQNAESEEVRRWKERTATLEREAREREAQYTQRLHVEAERRVAGHLDQVLHADIDAALKVGKATVDPLVYEAVKTKLATEILQRIEQIPDALNTLKLRKEEALRSNDPQAIKTVTKEWRLRYKPILEARRAEVLKAMGVTVKNGAERTVAQLQKAVGRVEPEGGVRAPGQGISIPAVKRNPGETNDQFAKRTIEAKMGALFQ